MVPPPNELIYKFEGTANIVDGNEHPLEGDIIRTKIPMDLENTIWSGCSVSKGSVVGIVIYNGPESKIMMNSIEGEIKRSLVTDELNDYSKILFFVMLTLSLVMMYLRGSSSNFFVQVFRYVLLLSTIIPISMKVNHDLSRLYYHNRVNNDIEISGCMARNSSVCEDLGRIEYFLTDKTGTLTRNEMIVRRVFVQGLGLIYEKEFTNEIKRSGKQGKLADFTACMMVCHSVSPSKDHDGKRILESTSPDEISFIQMMESHSLFLESKTDQLGQFKDENGQKVNFKIYQSFPFTSERKRMGMICQREGDEHLTLFVKGADSIMKDKLKVAHQETMSSHTAEMAADGLRTLALAKRSMTVAEFEVWKKEFHAANTSLKRRTEKVEACISAIERDMDFVGITAVEDLLQTNVKPSIEVLREAGIKVWMLTGDKLETAKCISLSTGLLSKRDHVWEVSGVTEGDVLRTKFGEFLREHDRSRVGSSHQSYFLLIDGVSLGEATRPDNRYLFMKVAMKASTVCCCRCAPSQKQTITALLKKLGKRVLGIGDGGNDVGMIQEAHVGVGIEGKEGKQAALASDYSVKEFQYGLVTRDVVKLVLWHGRMIYMTCSKMCSFVMHRGLIIATIQFYFMLIFFFIDIPIFNGFLVFGYSTIFTNLPVIAIIMDEDLSYETVKNYPQLYLELQKGRLLNYKAFFVMFLKGVFQVGKIYCRDLSSSSLQLHFSQEIQ